MPDFNSEEESLGQQQQQGVDFNSRLSSSIVDTGSLVAAIALRIRQSLELEVILQQTVAEVRKFLQTDRVLVYRFEPDFSGVVVVESVQESNLGVLGHKSLHDPCFVEKYIAEYSQGRIHA
ncbi:MAG: GAF domain-containing protein, partial [Cyanobacteria bacterium P01_C01_bin.72]